MVCGDNSGASQKCSVLKKISNGIEHGLETFFYRFGYAVGSHPRWTIVVMLLVAGLSAGGLLRFRQESRDTKLWVPSNADALKHKKWVDEYFPETARYSSFILTSTEGTNILSPKVLQKLYHLHETIVNITSPGSSFIQKHNVSWPQLCFRRDPRHCWIDSILSLWEFDKVKIYKLSESDILSELNKDNLTDPWNGGVFPIHQTIGGISDTNNHIVGARALHIVYRIFANITFNDNLGANEDDRADDFESEVDKIGQRTYESFRSSVLTEYGFDQEASKAIQDDLTLLAGGYALILFYVCINLGQATRLKHRLWLSVAGIISTGLGMLVSFGLCSAFGLFYGPVHSVLPFLLIGVGVDDMFVIVSSWENLPDQTHKEKDIATRIGLTLSKAGVSVTVTSLTDLAAFLIGASTILPALRSFCVFAGIGILFDFVFQVTFFTAFLAIDGRRVDAHRDACCCYRLPDSYKETKCCWSWWPFTSGWLKRFIGDVYAPTLMKLPVKVLVILVTAIAFGVSVHGLRSLEQHFDFKWFLPSGSYVLNYFDNQDLYFPSSGVSTAVYTGDVNYYAETNELSELGRDVSNNKYIIPNTLEYWYVEYETWLKENLIPKPENEEKFSRTVWSFLRTSVGHRYQSDVKFENGSQQIVATRLIVKHRRLKDSGDKVDAMLSMRHTVDSVQLYPEKAFAYGPAYVNWETSLVIREELFRNLGLALLCVFLVTLLLIAHVWTSFLVLCCVLLTLVNTAGMMHFWGLTIDVVTTIVLILAIGLAVDYSAHIGHGFMLPDDRAKTKNERAVLTLGTIGTAVWNGGFSTFVAFVLLSSSESYVFRTFFKVFFLIVVFGLFHGLCFLPVVLSLLGPAPYSHKGCTNEVGPKLQSTGVTYSGEMSTVFENSLASQQDHCDSTPVHTEARATNNDALNEGKEIEPGTCTLPPKRSSYDDAEFTRELIV